MSNEAIVERDLGRNKDGVMATICTAPLDRNAVFEEAGDEHDIDDPMPAYDVRAGCDEAMSFFQLTSDVTANASFLGKPMRLRDIPDVEHVDVEDNWWMTDKEKRELELEAIALGVDELLFVKTRSRKEWDAHHHECKRGGAYVSPRNHGRKSRRMQWRKTMRVFHKPLIEKIFDSSDTMTFSEAWEAYRAWYDEMVRDLPLNGTIVTRHNRRRADQKALSRADAQHRNRDEEEYLKDLIDRDNWEGETDLEPESDLISFGDADERDALETKYGVWIWVESDEQELFDDFEDSLFV